MSTSQEIISAIQRAGEAVYAAQRDLAAATQAQASSVAHAISTNPFGLENDNLFNSWKTLARLAQEVQSIDQQLRSIHATASSLLVDNKVAVSTMPRLAAPSPSDQLRGQQLVASIPSLKVGGGAAKVLAYLETVLSSADFTPITQGEIAEGAGIPRGSVGFALKQLTERGLIAEADKGIFKLM